jgi:hypothetical protein
MLRHTGILTAASTSGRASCESSFVITAWTTRRNVHGRIRYAPPAGRFTARVNWSRPVTSRGAREGSGTGPAATLERRYRPASIRFRSAGQACDGLFCRPSDFAVAEAPPRRFHHADVSVALARGGASWLSWSRHVTRPTSPVQRPPEGRGKNLDQSGQLASCRSAPIIDGFNGATGVIRHDCSVRSWWTCFDWTAKSSAGTPAKRDPQAGGIRYVRRSWPDILKGKPVSRYPSGAT